MQLVPYGLSIDPPQVGADGRVVTTLRTVLDPNYDFSAAHPAVEASERHYPIDLGRLAPGRHTFVLENDGRVVAEADFTVGG
jgi:hypothetical protein